MAFDAFLELDGIDGESSDDKHSGWIDVLAFEHSANQPNAGSVGSRGVERVTQGPFVFKHEIDKSSPKLQVAMHTGSNIAAGTLEVCKATGEKTVYYKIELKNISVGKMHTVGDSKLTSEPAAAGDFVPLAPIEEVTLWPQEITWTYTETDHETGAAKGNVEGKYDYEHNKGG